MTNSVPIHSEVSFHLGHCDEPNDSYTKAVRETLASFHINLSKGDYASNGPLNAPDAQWNYDGQWVIGRDNFVRALQTTVESFAKGLQARDYYQLVDGNVGATLFALYGNQTGPFGEVPVTPGAHFNTMTGEVFVFNERAESRALWTIDQQGRIAQQLSGQAEVPSIDSIPASKVNPQTSSGYRAVLRRKMAMLHANVNAGKPQANAFLATEDVAVIDNGRTTDGRPAFVEHAAARQAGLGSFPDKIFHDDYIIADGKLGVVSSVWQAPQEKAYNGIEPVEGAQVRMREMLWFEFNDDALITRVTAVYDEAVVEPQLRSKHLYP